MQKKKLVDIYPKIKECTQSVLKKYIYYNII